MAKDGRSIVQEIDELKSKIALLQGDHKAYYESSQWTMKQNHQKISTMRKENNEMRKKLRDSLSADDHVINEAFVNKPVERASLKNKTSSQAVERMDSIICDLEKRLNGLRNQRVRRQKKVEETQTAYESMVKDSSSAVAGDTGESEDAQQERSLENRLDKAQLKVHEAEHIARTYGQIKSRLEVEQFNYPNKIDDLEAEIKATDNELAHLRQVHKDALLSREGAGGELSKHEETVYSERKNREQELQTMRKEAEERRLAQERMEKRLQRNASVTDGDYNQGAPGDRNSVDELEREKIHSYEEAFSRIKDATGVADIREVVTRFESQGEDCVHLQGLKAENEQAIEKLNDEKRKMKETLEAKKYTGEAQLSSGQRLVEDFERHVSTEGSRVNDMDSKMQRSTRLLVDTRAGVEHLSQKLQHIKTGRSVAGKVNPNSEEYVLDQLSECEERLLKLTEQLEKEDEAELKRKMVDEDFHGQLENKLPVYNTRIAGGPESRDMFGDDDESGDDAAGGEVMSRNQLKAQARAMIEARTKRAPQVKKKKKR